MCMYAWPALVYEDTSIVCSSCIDQVCTVKDINGPARESHLHREWSPVIIRETLLCKEQNTTMGWLGRRAVPTLKLFYFPIQRPPEVLYSSYTTAVCQQLQFFIYLKNNDILAIYSCVSLFWRLSCVGKLKWKRKNFISDLTLRTFSPELLYEHFTIPTIILFLNVLMWGTCTGCYSNLMQC